MKKKTIEKIPYLTLRKLSRKRGVEYIGVTALVEVAGEQMLMLEMYRNTKECRETPKARIILGAKDFGTFFPESGEWSRGRITRNTWDCYGLIWREEDERISKTISVMIAENVLSSGEDLERIQKFTKDHVYAYNKGKWWEYIDQYQETILRKENHERSARRYERRQEALDDRAANTLKLPAKRIKSYAEEHIFNREHLLFYKKHGVRAQVACTKCGGVTDARWKPGDTYESQFEKHMQEPRHGQAGKCPMCGAPIVYTAQGKFRTFIRQTGHLFLGEKYKESGMVVRYVKVGKEWRLDQIPGECGAEMNGASEKLEITEVARAYFEPGKKLQIDYNKYNPWTGKTYWDDCNLTGLSSIRIGKAQVLPETYENMKETMFKYSAMKEYSQMESRYNPVDYLNRYQETPQIEVLVKMGLRGVVNSLLDCRYGIVADASAKRLDQFLGIRKERIHLLIEREGSLDLLDVMQMEHQIGARWTDEQLEHIAEADLARGELQTITEYMTVQQLLNRIAKYAKAEWGTGCIEAEQQLRHTATTYIDYLSMRLRLGYDLHNTVYQQPRDLTEAHTRMVEEGNQRKIDERLCAVAAASPDIRKRYRKLRNRYFWEDENLLIRPARSAEEIVEEGRILHHCVGGDNYLRKHNQGETYILMLRQQTDPETPYITVEIDAKKDSIIQWYGAHDKKPDQKNMQKWLDSYIARLKSGCLAAGMETDAGAAEPLLMALA